MAVIICATVSAVNDYQKERQFLTLNKVADSRKKVTARRNNQNVEIHYDDLLVGDIISLS
jgi:magnesium-transporting ATPase (P-type)